MQNSDAVFSKTFTVSHTYKTIHLSFGKKYTALKYYYLMKVYTNKYLLLLFKRSNYTTE